LITIKDFNYKNLIFVTISSALMLSTKYTALLLFPSAAILILFIFYDHRAKAKICARKSFIFSLFLLFIFTFLTINYGIFFKAKLFVSDFIYNLENYARFESNIDGVLFYLFCILLLFSSCLSILFFFYGYKQIYEKTKWSFYILFLTSIFYILYAGLAGIVLHRNVSILIPYLIPVISMGCYFFIDKFIQNQFKNGSAIKGYFYLSIFLLSFSYSLFQFYVILFNDFLKDSRQVANEWVIENINSNITIGVNEACFYPTAGRVNNNYEIDPYFEKKYDYYVIESYWPSAISNLDRGKNYLFEFNQTKIHYYYFNNRNIIYPDVSNSIPENYSIIRVFANYGPKVYILKKKDDVK
jgi:hypothetical protein